MSKRNPYDAANGGKNAAPKKAYVSRPKKGSPYEGTKTEVVSGTGLLEQLKSNPITEADKDVLAEYVKFMTESWHTPTDRELENSKNYGWVDVFVGWVDDRTDKVNGGYEAESYMVHGNVTAGTGRAGMKMYLENGYKILRLTINGKDCTDRIEEFEHFILVNDKKFEV